jgi:hypothetical protein
MRKAFLVVMMSGLMAGSAAAQTSLETPPVGTLAQIMRGIYFPNSNIIFDTQMRDPAAPPEETGVGGTVSNTFAGIYTGWQVVENAALVLAEGASLINKQGRLCENGRMAPVGRYDWLKWSREMTDVGWDIYQAALEKDQEAVGELTNDLAQACDNCHRVYRSNAQANTLRCLGSGIILAP